MREGREIDMGGKIGFARFGQRAGEEMAFDRLKGLAEAAVAMTVIDDQRDAAKLRHAPGDVGGNRRAGGADFEQGARGRAAQLFRNERRRHRLRRQRENQLARPWP